MADGAAPFWLLAQTGTPAAAPTTAPAAVSAPAPAGSGSTAAPLAGPDLNPPPSNPLGMLPFLLLLAAMYFFIFAPQMKRNKLHQKLLKELKSGDEVMTTGGLFGTIVQVKPDRFVVEIAKGIRIEVNRANVEVRAPSADAKDQPADEKKL